MKKRIAPPSPDNTSHPYFWLGVGTGVATVAALPRALAWVFLHPPRHLSAQTPKSRFGIAYESIRLRTSDGVPLAAWYVVPSPAVPTRGVVLVCHGYTGNRATMLDYLPFLHHAGYAVVHLEFRAHGWSGGYLTTFGHREPLDLDAALNWTETRPELQNLPIALLGESMGAAVALLVAAGEPRVRAVVADSPFARFDAAVSGRMQLTFGSWFGPALLPGVLRAGTRILGIDCTSISPEEAIRQVAPRPVLLIHGLADRLLVPENSRRIHAAAPGNVTFWEIEGVAHARAVHDHPAEYGKRVVAFLGENLPKSYANPL